MKITDVLGCVGGATFLLFAYTLIPVVGPLFGLLTPLPFLFYSTKLGFYQGVKLAAMATLTIAMLAKLTGSPQSFLFCMELSLLGLVLSELLKRKLNFGQTIFLATVFMLLLGFGFLFFIALSKNMGPLEMVLNYMESHVKRTIAAYGEMGIPLEKTIELEALGQAFMDIILKIYLSLMIIGAGFAVWLNVVLAKPLFRMGNLEYPDFTPMDRWQAPDGLVWGVIVSGFALFLLSGGIELLAINALIVMMVIYFFYGLSIILFFLNKYHVPSWIRIGLYFLIIIQQFLGVALVLAGLFDQWVDFRKIHRRMDPSTG